MADRINLLPDEVLCHILSFLQTKEAVTTSLLVSKRWNPLWRSLPALNFDDDCLPDNDDDSDVVNQIHSVKNFVETVISSRHLNQSIKTFRLSLGEIYYLYHYGDDSDVENWINAVVQPGFEQLHVTVDVTMNLPSSVLSCSTIAVLKLHAVIVKLETLSSVDLPSLKILHLKYVDFSEGRYLAEILSACPVLEDLEIRCSSKSASSFAGEAIYENSLPMLFRANIHNYCLLLKAVRNVHFLHIEEVELRYSYKDIPVFQNLTELNFNFDSFSCHRMVEMIKHCPKLQILVIEKMNVGEMGEENWAYAYPQHVPECLSLHLRTCTFKEYVGDKGEFTFARYIMQNARVLQTITICGDIMEDGEIIQILKKLSMCSRISPTCQLVYEEKRWVKYRQ